MCAPVTGRLPCHGRFGCWILVTEVLVVAAGAVFLVLDLGSDPDHEPESAALPVDLSDGTSDLDVEI